MNKEPRVKNMRIKKGIYLLPNLLTTASLFAGFYSIIASVQGKYYIAAIAILVSLVFDGLDGRIARMTNTTSKFGAEYDSLSDLIAFGVAPSLLVYIWAMSSDEKLGLFAGFLFVACGALRLARYNIQIGIIDSKVFNGLPIPAAASVIATAVIFFHFVGIEGKYYQSYIIYSVILLSLLMVSNIKYYSFKGMNFHTRMPFKIFLIVVGILLLICYLLFISTISLSLWPFVIFMGYAISGPVWWVIKLGQKITSRAKEK